MGKIEIKYGIITGLGVSAYVMLEFLLGLHTKYIEIGEFSGYFSAIIPILTLYFAFREKRDLQPGSILPYGKGFLTGLYISIIASFIIAVFFSIYYAYINPDFIKDGAEYARNKMIAMHVSQAKIDQELKDEAEMSRQPMQFFLTFVGTVFPGIMLSLIMVLIMKKKRVSKA